MKETKLFSCFYMFTCIIFATVLYILNYYTPLQSDDYGYSIIGFNLESHLHHYMTWSGRVVADFISPTLLLIDSKYTLSLIQTCAVLLLIYFIVNFKTERKQESLFIFSLVSFIFFLSHPSFGQSNLWIVGSANYLWTSVLYVYVTVSIIKYLIDDKFSIIIYPVALLAGCTNENACIALIGILILAIVLKFYKNKRIDIRLLATLILAVLGAIILLCTPGNESRMMDPSFESWRNLSLLEKISLHIFDRFPDVFKSSKLAYSTAIILIIASIFTHDNKIIDKNGRPTYLSISIILLLMSIGCSLIMAFSPTFPDRAKTPSFIFCLISISYSLWNIYQKNICRKIFNLFHVVLFITFIFEACPTLSAYHSIYNQNLMRLNTINKSDINEDKTLIPEFYFNFLPSNTYKFDTWTNFDAMSKYYNRNKIVSYGTIFDFSKIDDTSYKIHSNADMSTTDGLKAIYAYPERYNLDSVFLFEVSHQERLLTEGNKSIFFHVIDIFGNYHNYAFSPNFAYVNDRVFLYAKLRNMPLWLVKSASFGVFDTESPSIRYSQIDFDI